MEKKHQKQDSKNFPDEQFDFNKECQEFLDSNFVKSITFHSINPGIKATLTLITLENHVFDMKWDSSGIKIVSAVDGKNGSQIQLSDPEQKFEDLYGFLSTYSVKYREAFQQRLNDKLLETFQNLEGLDDRRFDRRFSSSEEDN